MVHLRSGEAVQCFIPADERDALRAHRKWLLAERERLERMAATVSRTITALDKGETMSAGDMFTGFDHNPYEQEARERSCMELGLPADDAAVQDVVAAHYRWVSTHWAPDAQLCPGLGQMYVDDARFTRFYDKVKPGLAAYLLEGIKVYAARNLQYG